MASGKQTSFSYGKVAKSFQFKSNQISYPEGLSDLKNFLVDSAGGVDNRTGFKYVAIHPYQNQIPSIGDEPGVKLLSFRDQSVPSDFTGVVARNPDMLLSYVKGITAIDGALNNSFLYRHDLVKGVDFTRIEQSPFPEPIGGKGNRAQLTKVNDQMIITFGQSVDSSVYYGVLRSALTETPALFQKYNTSKAAGLSAALSALTTTGLAPLNIPVTYLISVEFFNGDEVVVGAYDAPGGHPHAQAQSSFTVTIAPIADMSEIKSLNVYRGQGKYLEGAVYGLIGKKPILDAATTVYNIEDFGVAVDITNGPPINRRLWNQTNPISLTTQPALQNIRRVAFYQQRLVVAYDETQSNDSVKEGAIGVSKIGAPTELDAPMIFNAIGAFEFTIPVERSSPVVGLIPLKRLVVVTENNCYVIQGDDAGILTPTSINPQLLSDVGGSSTIAPVYSGGRGYYLSSSHEKIMAVVPSDIDSGVFSVIDISLTAEDIVREFDITGLSVTTGKSDILWLNRSDGKLISITISAQGVAGFAVHETDGYIESSVAVKHYVEYFPYSGPVVGVLQGPYKKQKEDVLACTVIRNGVRYVEYLPVRYIKDDAKTFFFLDSFTSIGSRLSFDSSAGRYTIAQQNAALLDGDISTNQSGVRPLLNIEGGITWEAGEAIELKSDVNFPLTVTLPAKVFFYYDDENGDEQTVVYNVLTGTWDGVSVYTVTGYFDSDLPVYLRNIAAQSLTAAEILKRQTRWVIPKNSVTISRFANTELGVYADGQVLSNPLNPNIAGSITADGTGIIDLGDYYAWAVIGLPYESEFETLDLESSDNRTLTDTKKLINAAGLAFDETRGGFVGGKDAAIADMSEIQFRTEDAVDVETPNYSGIIEESIAGTWEKTGRIRIKQVDPLPMTILSVYPKGVSSE